MEYASMYINTAVNIIIAMKTAPTKHWQIKGTRTQIQMKSTLRVFTS